MSLLRLYVALTASLVLAAPALAASDNLAARFQKLDRDTRWTQVDKVSLDFDAYHPQGLVKVGDSFFLSAAQVQDLPVKYDKPQGRYDRSPGRGIGHLFRFDRHGHLTGQLVLGEGRAFHPGGIDYDGHWLWVPAAEYRPNSQAIVYRIDPKTLTHEVVLRYPDHLGALVRQPGDAHLYAVSWGSRRFYSWKLDAQDRPVGKPSMRLNGSHYVDYQDCHALGNGQALCDGITLYDVPGRGKFGFGGIELVNLAQGQAVHQVPVPLWVEPEVPMTRNPFYFEKQGAGLRFYFAPEDNRSHLFIYDATPKP